MAPAAPGPPHVDIDKLLWPDIKQDAWLRAIVALQRAGKPVGPNPVTAFNAEPQLAQTAYLFHLPTFIILGTFLVYPLFASVWYSLHEYNVI